MHVDTIFTILSASALAGFIFKEWYRNRPSKCTNCQANDMLRRLYTIDKAPIR